MLTVSYGGPVEANLGNTLKVNETQNRPEIHASFTDPDASDSGNTYTLIFTDPDAPSRTDKSYSEYVHHIVTGLKLKAINSGSTSPGEFSASDVAASFATPIEFDSGNELVPYMGPGPPPKTGLHRYIYILFKETKPSLTKFHGDRPRFGTDKPGHGVRAFAAEHGLIPIAINFYYAQNETQ